MLNPARDTRFGCGAAEPRNVDVGLLGRYWYCLVAYDSIPINRSFHLAITVRVMFIRFITINWPRFCNRRLPTWGGH